MSAWCVSAHGVCQQPLSQTRQPLRSPVNGATGERVKPIGYVNMIDEDGQPRLLTRATMRRKLGKIAKGKAPGLSGNGLDLYTSLPDEWFDWAVELANIIQ